MTPAPPKLRHQLIDLGQHHCGWPQVVHHPWTWAQSQSVHEAGSGIRAPWTAMAFAPLPDASLDRWKAGFIPEARGMQPPAEPVGVSKLNHATSLLEFVTTDSCSSGHQGNASCHQAPVLRWLGKPGGILDEVPAYGCLLMLGRRVHISLSLCQLGGRHEAGAGGTGGQALWDVGRRAITADLVHLF